MFQNPVILLQALCRWPPLTFCLGFSVQFLTRYFFLKNISKRVKDNTSPLVTMSWFDKYFMFITFATSRLDLFLQGLSRELSTCFTRNDLNQLKDSGEKTKHMHVEVYVAVSFVRRRWLDSKSSFHRFCLTLSSISLSYNIATIELMKEQSKRN